MRFPPPPLRNLPGRVGAGVEGLRLYYVSLGAPAPYGGPGAPPPPPGGAARAAGGGTAAAGWRRSAVSLLSAVSIASVKACVSEKEWSSREMVRRAANWVRVSSETLSTRCRLGPGPWKSGSVRALFSEISRFEPAEASAMGR